MTCDNLRGEELKAINNYAFEGMKSTDCQAASGIQRRHTFILYNNVLSLFKRAINVKVYHHLKEKPLQQTNHGACM